MFGRATTSTRRVTVVRRAGLHARPCLAIANTVRRFNAKVEICRGREKVNAGDVLQLMTLGAPQGTELTISASGPEAEPALDALEHLFADGFGLPGD